MGIFPFPWLGRSLKPFGDTFPTLIGRLDAARTTGLVQPGTVHCTYPGLRRRALPMNWVLAWHTTAADAYIA